MNNLCDIAYIHILRPKLKEFSFLCLNGELNSTNYAEKKIEIDVCLESCNSVGGKIVWQEFMLMVYIYFLFFFLFTIWRDFGNLILFLEMNLREFLWGYYVISDDSFIVGFFSFFYFWWVLLVFFMPFADIEIRFII